MDGRSPDARKSGAMLTPDRPGWPSLAALGLVLAKLWLTGAQTVTALGMADHDDRLFLRLADALLSGHWLGKYDYLILIKAPFYPLWIALVHFLGIPLLLSQQILYAVACWVFVVALRPLLRGEGGRLLLFTLLLFNPISFQDGAATRVMREGIYPALTLLVAACAFAIALRSGRESPCPRRWLMGLGVALAAFWLTREEGVWMLPLVGICLAWAACRSHGGNILSLVAGFVIPGLIWAGAVATVAGINKHQYGVFTTAEQKWAPFLSAYGALTRVRHAHWNPYVPVPQEARERIYAASPAFAELRPFLEGRIGRDRIEDSCQALSICDDIAGGWFQWALRGAIRAAGHYGSGPDAARYYRRLAREVNRACDEGRLDCLPPRASLLSPWRSDYFRPWVDAVFRGGKELFGFAGTQPVPGPSAGPRERLFFFEDLTRTRLAPRHELCRVEGWMFSPHPALRLSLHRPNGDLVNNVSVVLRQNPVGHASVLRQEPDLPKAGETPFEIRDIRCQALSNFHLRFSSGDRTVHDLELGKPLPTPPNCLETPDLRLCIAYFGVQDDRPPRALAQYDSWKLKFLGGIGAAYETLSPPLSLLALFAYLARGGLALFRDRVMPPAWIIGTALLAAIAARLAILAWLEVSSFRTLNPHYCSAAYPLVLAFVFTALWPMERGQAGGSAAGRFARLESLRRLFGTPGGCRSGRAGE